MWSRFNDVYGHQWASQHGDEPSDTWIMGLEPLSPEQINHGLSALTSRQDKWPPNLVEFVHLCTDYDPQAWERRAHRIVDQSTLLEDKTSRERRIEQGKQEVAKLREALGF